MHAAKWTAIGLIAGVVACASFSDEIAQRANTHFVLLERNHAASTDGADADLEANLWRDKPEYVALLYQHHAKFMRMLTAVRPQVSSYLRFTPAQVRVSYIVGPDGKVEDARILMSTDSRFDSPMLEAIRQYTFQPARSSTGRPESEIAVQGFSFLATAL